MKIFPIVTIIIFGIFLSGCTIKNTESNSIIRVQKFPPSTVEECETFAEVEQVGSGFKYTKDDCYGYWAGNKKDVSYCQEIKNSAQKQACIYEIAQINQNTSLCKQLTDKDQRGLCIAEIVYFTDEYKYCDEITDSVHRHTCFFDTANNPTPGVCDNLDLYGQSEGIAVSCIARENEASCAPYIDMPLNSKNVGAKFICNNSLAVRKMDPTYCLKNENQDRIDLCYYTYAIQYADLNYCNKLHDGEYPTIDSLGLYHPEFSKDKCIEVVNYLKVNGTGVPRTN